MKRWCFVCGLLAIGFVGNPVQVLPAPDRVRKPPPNSALAEAVGDNRLGTVKTLLAKGVSPNLQNKQGSPILVVAASKGYTAIVQALLDKGADPNRRNKEGATALLEAAGSGHLDVVKALLAHKAAVDAGYNRDGLMKGFTPLMTAAMSEQKDVVEALLKAGASVKAKDSQGNTALHWAANQGSLPIAQRLVERGAEVDARTWVGMTPLMGAATEGRLDMAKFLIAKGANVNAKDDANRRAYGFAGFAGGSKDQQQLLKSGKLGNLQKRQENGNSVLDWAKIAARAGSKSATEMIELLKQAGAKE